MARSAKSLRIVVLRTHLVDPKPLPRGESRAVDPCRDIPVDNQRIFFHDDAHYRGVLILFCFYFSTLASMSGNL